MPKNNTTLNSNVFGELTNRHYDSLVHLVMGGHLNNAHAMSHLNHPEEYVGSILSKSDLVVLPLSRNEMVAPDEPNYVLEKGSIDDFFDRTNASTPSEKKQRLHLPFPKMGIESVSGMILFSKQANPYVFDGITVKHILQDGQPRLSVQVYQTTVEKQPNSVTGETENLYECVWRNFKAVSHPPTNDYLESIQREQKEATDLFIVQLAYALDPVYVWVEKLSKKAQNRIEQGVWREEPLKKEERPYFQLIRRRDIPSWLQSPDGLGNPVFRPTSRDRPPTIFSNAEEYSTQKEFFDALWEYQPYDDGVIKGTQGIRYRFWMQTKPGKLEAYVP